MVGCCWTPYREGLKIILRPRQEDLLKQIDHPRDKSNLGKRCRESIGFKNLCYQYFNGKDLCGMDIKAKQLSICQTLGNR